MKTMWTAMLAAAMMFSGIDAAFAARAMKVYTLILTIPAKQTYTLVSAKTTTATTLSATVTKAKTPSFVMKTIIKNGKKVYVLVPHI